MLSESLMKKFNSRHWWVWIRARICRVWPAVEKTPKAKWLTSRAPSRRRGKSHSAIMKLKETVFLTGYRVEIIELMGMRGAKSQCDGNISLNMMIPGNLLENACYGTDVGLTGLDVSSSSLQLEGKQLSSLGSLMFLGALPVGV